MLESFIARHCAPALAGIKPANIVAILKAQFADTRDELDTLNRSLNHRDIFFEVLCECDRRLLVMVYRKKRLSECLSNPEIAEFLVSYGYPGGASLETMLEHLRQRVAGGIDFPHEIGAFLGYPLCDILGFLNHKGVGCKLTGYWKVYGDEQGARVMFERYDRCRKALIKHVANGHSLAQLFCA